MGDGILDGPHLFDIMRIRRLNFTYVRFGVFSCKVAELCRAFPKVDVEGFIYKDRLFGK